MDGNLSGLGCNGTNASIKTARILGLCRGLKVQESVVKPLPPGFLARFPKGFLLTLEELKAAPGLQNGSEARARWLPPFLVSLSHSLQATPHDGSLPDSKPARLSYRRKNRSGLRDEHAIQVIHIAHLTKVRTNKMSKLGNLWVPPCSPDISGPESSGPSPSSPWLGDLGNGRSAADKYQQ